MAGTPTASPSAPTPHFSTMTCCTPAIWGGRTPRCFVPTREERRTSSMARGCARSPAARLRAPDEALQLLDYTFVILQRGEEEVRFGAAQCLLRHDAGCHGDGKRPVRLSGFNVEDGVADHHRV